MSTQEHSRYSDKALNDIRQARDAGRLDEAKDALRAHDRGRRKKKP